MTITSTTGNKTTYPCGGVTDQEALIYAGKVVEKHADVDDSDATVTISKDGVDIGPVATVAELTKKAV